MGLPVGVMSINHRGRDDSAPAFYATPSFVHGKRAREWWTLAHPPYTLCHLSFVVVGACLQGPVNGARLAVTLAAFFLAVGVGAHALDEIHGRPLATSIPLWQLVVVSGIGLGGACALGVYGMLSVSRSLVYFIILGVAVAVGYNLELFHGRLHNDVVFALGWGGFPVVTAYFAQHGTLDPVALVAALYAIMIAITQRRLSTPARILRRSTSTVEGSITMLDGRRSPLTRDALLVPLERTLRSLCWSAELLAAALAFERFHIHF